MNLLEKIAIALFAFGIIIIFIPPLGIMVGIIMIISGVLIGLITIVYERYRSVKEGRDLK